MKMNKENLINQSGRLSYEAPCVNAQIVELEQGIAAGSGGGNIQGESMTESWGTEKQSQEVQW